MAKKNPVLFIDHKHRRYPSPDLIPRLYAQLRTVASPLNQWIPEYCSPVWKTWCQPKSVWEKQTPMALDGAIELARLLRASQPALASKRHKLPWRVYNVVTGQMVVL